MNLSLSLPSTVQFWNTVQNPSLYLNTEKKTTTLAERWQQCKEAHNKCKIVFKWTFCSLSLSEANQVQHTQCTVQQKGQRRIKRIAAFQLTITCSNNLHWQCLPLPRKCSTADQFSLKIISPHFVQSSEEKPTITNSGRFPGKWTPFFVQSMDHSLAITRGSVHWHHQAHI